MHVPQLLLTELLQCFTKILVVASSTLEEGT